MFPRTITELLTLIERMTPLTLIAKPQAYLEIPDTETPRDPMFEPPHFHRFVYHTLTDTGFVTEGESPSGWGSEAEACSAFWRNFCCYIATPGKIVWRRLPELDVQDDPVQGRKRFRVSARLTLIPSHLKVPAWRPEATDAA